MKEIKKKNNMALSNSLIRSKYMLTKEEQNLIYLLISQIDKDDEDFKDYRISVADLDNITKKEHNRARIKKLQDSILKKPLYIDEYKAVNWFSYIEIVPNESAIIVRFDKALKPHLIRLKEFFTKTELTTLLNFTSKYTSRLYLLLKSDFDKQKQFVSKVKVKYEVEYFNNSFQLPKSYCNRYNNFRREFLDNSINEINQKTNLRISYNEIKQGRKVVEIEFEISELKELYALDIKAKSKIKPLSPELLGISPTGTIGLNLRSILWEFNRDHQDILIDDCEFNAKDLNHIIQNHTKDKIEDICIEIANKYHRIKNKKAFFRSKLKKSSLDF